MSKAVDLREPPAGGPRLFGNLGAGVHTPLHIDAVGSSAEGSIVDDFSTTVDERIRQIYEHARDPEDPFELRDLYLGRVEHEMEKEPIRPDLALRWATSKPKRSISAEEVLRSRATARFVKELFNWFFREDLYGDLRSDDHIILSSGSADEELYGLPEVLKECIRYALARDWYGYSDSRGRIPAREAVAAYESTRARGLHYESTNVALTMGGTFAISGLVDFISLSRPSKQPAICAIPNYPPLVEAVARRGKVDLVPIGCRRGATSAAALIDALTPDTPLVLLQTVTNPTGTAVAEDELEALIRAASASTIIILDECHECLGPAARPSPARAAPNVVRVSSISKTWSAPGLKLGWILADGAFVDDYYEYASTSFGGPPSFFYTLVEVLTRMERWLLEGLASPGRSEVAEFEPSYSLSVDAVARAYEEYVTERNTREGTLTRLRHASATRIGNLPAKVVRPSHSINVAVDLPGARDSYRTFRTLLDRAAVAVFPGILTFCLSGGTVRITTARSWSDMDRGLAALEKVDLS